MGIVLNFVTLELQFDLILTNLGGLQIDRIFELHIGNSA
jgi:hypothetical protein